MKRFQIFKNVVFILIFLIISEEEVKLLRFSLQIFFIITII